MLNYGLISLGELLENLEENYISEIFKKFSCNREKDLEDFLNCKAILYDKSGIGKTYIFFDLDAKEFEVLGYFTLAQKTLNLSQISKTQRKKLLGSQYPGIKRINEVPVYLIGQLGRSDSYKALDLSGEIMLNECYKQISIASRVVGGNIIILECKQEMYEKVYKKKEFNLLEDKLNERGYYTLFKKVDFSEYWRSKEEG